MNNAARKKAASVLFSIVGIILLLTAIISTTEMQKTIRLIDDMVFMGLVMTIISWRGSARIWVGIVLSILSGAGLLWGSHFFISGFLWDALFGGLLLILAGGFWYLD